MNCDHNVNIFDLATFLARYPREVACAEDLLAGQEQWGHQGEYEVDWDTAAAAVDWILTIFSGAELTGYIDRLEMSASLYDGTQMGAEIAAVLSYLQ